MKRERLDLALERLKGSQWGRFEEFASEFLSGEFPNLRTVASPSGDQGRDAELFSEADNSSVLLQYSVRADWESKIRETAERLSETLPEAQVLIYATNQIVGANGDSLRKQLREEHRLHLDIRDRNWFLERRNSGAQQEGAAESLAEDIVDPYLASREIIDDKPSALTNPELRAALLYLSLQRKDNTEERNLTKLSFEALILVTLRGTDNDNRLSREEVQSRVNQILPSHQKDRIATYVNSALSRLDKSHVRHWKQHDEFCLSHSERQREQEQLETHEAAEAKLNRELFDAVKDELFEDASESQLESLATSLRKLLEQFFFRRGELFASAVHTGQYHHLGFDQVEDLVIGLIADDPVDAPDHTNPVDLLARALRRILTSPSEPVQRRLRSLSDAYTLLAFLQLAPDVQSATRKMFSHGVVWLDTTVLLPVFAEQLYDQMGQKRFTRLLRSAGEAGMSLHVTDGVLEEISKHMDRAIVCARMSASEWIGRIPFLFAEFLSQGRGRKEFPGWIKLFKGHKRPLDDIADFLNTLLGIEAKNLEEQVEAAPNELKMGVEEIWHEAHQRRRSAKSTISPGIRGRLVRHDVENYVGVLQRRKESGRKTTGFGYQYWWLTLDQTAFRVREKLREWLEGEPPDTPVMSADFLSNYLAFGPTRARAVTSFEDIPVVLDVGLIELSPKLVQYADEVREKMKGAPEYVIRREVRDEFDEARKRLGDLAWSGMQTLDEESAAE